MTVFPLELATLRLMGCLPVVSAESKPVGLIIVILGRESAAIHVQEVRVTITVGRGRPPVPEGVLDAQVTIAPGVAA